MTSTLPSPWLVAADLFNPPPVGVSPYVPHTPHPPQQEFLDLECLDALFGGAAGPGKSWALLAAALQYVHVPRYAAILFRRTYEDLKLPGALISRSKEWLYGTDARWNENAHRWTFPSGATLSFGYLQHPEDHFRYQGAEFQYCVALGTPVLMADGDWRPIELVDVGDEVATLEGPRPVLATHDVGMKPVSRVTTCAGTSVVSDSHRMLTPYGWVSPAALTSTGFRAARSTGEWSSWRDQEVAQRYASIPPDLRLLDERRRRFQAHTHHQAGSAWSTDGQSDCGACCGSHPADPRLLASIVPVTLLARLLPSAESWSAAGTPHDAVDRVNDANGVLGSPLDYRGERRCDDGQPHPARARALEGIPSRGDAAVPTRSSRPLDGQDCTHARIPQEWSSVRHPYTSRALDVVEAVRPAFAAMVPAGAAEVRDLTVAGASHYVAWGGIIVQNCGIDEAGQIRENQLRYMFSRLRRPDNVETGDPLGKVPLRMRLASNPGGRSHEYMKRRYVQRLPDPDDPEDTVERAEARVFVPARLQDNPSVDQKAYRESLAALDPAERAQLLDGDWDARGLGDWFFPDLSGVIALGQRYEEDLQAGELVPPSGGVLHLGIDWGQSSSAVLLWPLEGGGFFVAREFNSYAEEPGVKTHKMLALREQIGADAIPWGRAFFDAAGVQSQATFNATAERVLGYARPSAKSIPFGAQAPRTARTARKSFKGVGCTYLRRMAVRATDGQRTQVLAISPRCPVLLRQMKMLRNDPEDAVGAWLKEEDQHACDALVAGVTLAANQFRVAVEEEAKQNGANGKARAV